MDKEADAVVRDLWGKLSEKPTWGSLSCPCIGQRRRGSTSLQCPIYRDKMAKLVCRQCLVTSRGEAFDETCLAMRIMDAGQTAARLCYGRDIPEFKTQYARSC